MNETIYIVLRPRVSEKEDHHNGNIDIDNMYNATERLVMVGVVLKSLDTCRSEAI